MGYRREKALKAFWREPSLRDANLTINERMERYAMCIPSIAFYGAESRAITNTLVTRVKEMEGNLGTQNSQVQEEA